MHPLFGISVSTGRLETLPQAGRSDSFVVCASDELYPYRLLNVGSQYHR